jgi:hypothetical protein
MTRLTTSPFPTSRYIFLSVPRVSSVPPGSQTIQIPPPAADGARPAHCCHSSSPVVICRDCTWPTSCNCTVPSGDCPVQSGANSPTSLRCVLPPSSGRPVLVILQHTRRPSSYSSQWEPKILNLFKLHSELKSLFEKKSLKMYFSTFFSVT